MTSSDGGRRAATPPAAVVAIDGGNSKTDVALVAADGTVLASLRGPGASQEDYGVPTAMRMLGQMVRDAARSAGITDAVVASHTSACLAGADLPSEEEELAAAMRAQGWSLTSAVANDTFAVLRAGLTTYSSWPAGPSWLSPWPAGAVRPWGVAVTCGAGINCVGVAPDGQTTRFLAQGVYTGDWGGGGGLAAAAMWWASRAEDGRGEPTALASAIAAHFGMSCMYDVAVAIHVGRITEDDLLRLSTVLFSVASSGDEVAISLVERQADEVCKMAVTAMRRLGLIDIEGTPVVLGGGVLEARDRLLTSSITSRLSSAAPGAVPIVVNSRPVIGAALLGLDFLATSAPSSTPLTSASLATPASRATSASPATPASRATPATAASLDAPASSDAPAAVATPAKWQGTDPAAERRLRAAAAKLPGPIP